MDQFYSTNNSKFIQFRHVLYYSACIHKPAYNGQWQLARHTKDFLTWDMFLCAKTETLQPWQEFKTPGATSKRSYYVHAIICSSDLHLENMTNDWKSGSLFLQSVTGIWLMGCLLKQCGCKYVILKVKLPEVTFTWQVTWLMIIIVSVFAQ